MTVRFYRQRPDGPEAVGAIVLRDRRLVAEPQDSIALNNILAEPTMLYQTKEPVLIDPRTQPEKFLKALSMMYSGTYFWAGHVED